MAGPRNGLGSLYSYFFQILRQRSLPVKFLQTKFTTGTLMLYFIRITLISEVLVSQKKINTYDVEEKQSAKEDMKLLFSFDVVLKKKGPTMRS